MTEPATVSAQAKRPAPFDVLAVLLLGAVTCALVNYAPGEVALRAVFGLPFLLVGIGYVVMSAMFGDELPEGSMQLMLVPALSVASLILIALALDVSQIGLGRRAIADTALGVALVAVTITAWRRRRGFVGGPQIRLGALARSRWTWSVLVAAAVFAGLLVVLARPLPNDRIAGYTALTSLRGPGSSVDVGVQSEEVRSDSYRLEVTPAGGPPQTRFFTLPPGGHWGARIVLTGPSLQTVRIALYRGTEAGVVYRQLTLRP